MTIEMVVLALAPGRVILAWSAVALRHVTEAVRVRG